MLTVKDIFDDLAAGALANLALTDSTTQTIAATQYPKVVSYINLALTALHKRFMLRTGEMVVQQYDGILNYTLTSAYAVSNVASVEPIKYIVDTAEKPFQDDIIKIEQVFSELGEEYIINDVNQEYPVYTPEFNILSMVPIDQAVFVIYRAKHHKILVTPTFNPAITYITLPDTMLDALYAKIAAYAFKGISGEDSEGSAAKNYSYQYELECMRLETENVTADDNDTINTFEERGWV